MTAAPESAPHRKLFPTDATAARWTHGFWGRVHERTRDVTVDSIWESLSDQDVSPGLHNFHIAAGLAKGDHVGPPFMDGDFYKWFEAAVARLETDPDEALAARLEELATLIASIQRADGYLHTPTAIAERNGQTATALADRFNFETYNLGHLITAGVRHWEVTGSRTLLEVAERAGSFLESLATDKPLELARSAICPSHYMAVLELHRATGDQRWVRLAESFLRVRDAFREGGDDNQDRIPVLDQQVAAGHAVRANYLYAGLADLVMQTGDKGLLATLERLWSDVVDTKLYITGGCGALYDGASPDGSPWQGDISRVHQSYGRAYQLPNTTAHAESCANIGLILWSERMLALTGEARYADVIEQVAFNSLLASISLSGTDFFYTNALRQVRGLPYPLRRPGDTGQAVVPEPPPSDERLRQRYMTCFCCPPNIARTLARLHERAASTSAAGLHIHLYGGSTLQASGTDWELALREESNYPWDERIRFEVTACNGESELQLRIPSWCRTGATLTVSGEKLPPPEPGSYATIRRNWAVGDTVELNLPMHPRLLRGHRLAEEITNQVAVQRGPVVYCLESADLPEDIALEQAALPHNARFTQHETEIDGWPLLGLRTRLGVLPHTPEDLYDDLTEPTHQGCEATLIPYFAWGNRGPGEMSVWLPVLWHGAVA